MAESDICEPYLQAFASYPRTVALWTGREQGNLSPAEEDEL